MAVKIRLARYGAKKNPFYRVVVANVSAPRDGRFLEIVGTYNPMVDPAKIEFKREKIIEWIKKGAKPTNTVQKLLKKGGILTKSLEDSSMRKD